MCITEPFLLLDSVQDGLIIAEKFAPVRNLITGRILRGTIVEKDRKSVENAALREEKLG